MALSDDQRAMLRLLAQREQGYEDMASLMGLSVEEVRAKVKEALAEIDTEDAPAPPAPSPSPPAPVSTPTPPEPVAAEPTAVAAKAPRSPRARVSMPSSRRRLFEWIGGASIVVLIVLFATGTIDLGGGSDSGGSSGGEAEAGATTPAAAKASQVTKAILAPVDGGSAKGAAVFGQLKGKIAMQVEAVGLDPSPTGSSYTIWLYKSPRLALRVGSVKVGASGGLAVRIEIPEEEFAAVATRVFDQVDISLTSDAAYKAEVAKAKKANRLPAYTGKDVLRGPLTGPVVKK